MNGNCIKVPDVAARLKISRAHAYQIVKREDFPKIMLGERIVVPEDLFIKWVEQQALPGSYIATQ